MCEERGFGFETHGQGSENVLMVWHLVGSDGQTRGAFPFPSEGAGRWESFCPSTHTAPLKGILVFN